MPACNWYRQAPVAVVLCGAMWLGACSSDQELPETVAVNGCLAPGSEAGDSGVITQEVQLAIYDAVVDSVRNLFGNTPMYLDPRVETVGQGKDSTRMHPDTVVTHLLAREVFQSLCLADDGSRCNVTEPGVSARFSGILRHRDGAIVVDVTQQTVRPASDSSDWYFWAAWARYWLELQDRCWRVRATELKGMV